MGIFVDTQRTIQDIQSRKILQSEKQEALYRRFVELRMARDYTLNSDVSWKVTSGLFDRAI